MSATEDKINQVVDAATRYGDKSVIALAGVPGTGKSFLGREAADRIATLPEMVREMQFHPSLTYDQFIEGLRIDADGATVFEDGLFLEWNDFALADESHTYVFLIEELTRTNVPAVIGELMTYVEHRDRHFDTLYARRRVSVAKNLRIIATYNPTDRSALNLDTALLRRLRIVQFPPDTGQLEEMLAPPRTSLSPAAIAALKQLFEECQKAHGADFASAMPFGHGIFAEVQDERPDLYDLWNERIGPMLRRPLVEPHPFTGTILAHYPWTDPHFEA
ncbi:MAG TPA: AAA family ATPase [Solirubrobacteraceae bacterium]|jgi:5-methylcytosine-specific restriction protein B